MSSKCKKCSQVVRQECDETLCDFEIQAKCVIVGALECVDTEEGEDLQVVLKAIDDKLCEITTGCETIEWVSPTGIREGIDTIKYALGCNGEVYLKGSIVLDDIETNTTTSIVLPIPTTSRILSVNAIEDNGSTSVIIPSVFGISITTGETYIIYNASDSIANPPTLTIFFDGQSYYI